MNTHFRAGIGLFLALTVITGAAGWAMGAIHDPIAAQLEQALIQTDATVATEHLQQANRQWERFQPLICVLADHSPMDEIDRLFAEASVCDPDTFAACCAQLRVLVAGMAQAHTFSWRNIL